jgi:hypothetical protein
MKDSLTEMTTNKNFAKLVPKGYRLPKNLQKKDSYLQEIKKFIPIFSSNSIML